MAPGYQEGAVSPLNFVSGQTVYCRRFTFTGENYQDLPLVQSGGCQIVKFLNFFDRGSVSFGDGKKRITFSDNMASELCNISPI